MPIGQYMADEGLSFPNIGVEPSPVPPHIVDVYNAVKNSLETDYNELHNIISTVIDDVHNELDAAEQEIVTNLSAFIGDVDNALTAVEDDVDRKVNTLYTSALRELMVVEKDLLGNNIGIPVNTLDMKADMEADDLSWIWERLNGNSQPVTPIVGSTETADEIHLCTACSETTKTTDVATEIANELDTSPVVNPAPIPSGPVPPGVDCGLPGKPMYGGIVPAPAICSFAKTMFPECCVLETQYDSAGNPIVQIVRCPGVDNYPDKNNGEWNASYDVNTQVTSWIRFCGTPVSPPPPPPPPPPPTDTICPPACPIPVDVTVKVEYPPPPVSPVSPPPPPLSGIPAIPGTGSFWTQRDVCDKAVTALSSPFPADLGKPPLDVKDSKSVFTRIADYAFPALKPTRMVFDWLAGGMTKEDAEKVAASELAEFGKFTSAAGPTASVIAGSLGLSAPNMPAAISIGTRIALAQKAEANSGFPAMYLAQNDWYLYQFANPQYLPTQSELNQAYSHDVIQPEQWRCLTMALGNQPEGMAWVVDAQQIRPIPSDIIGLYNRGIINRDQFYKKMREAGVLNQINSDYFYDLSRYVPPPTDLVRYMVRDVTDRTVVEQYGLDKDFEAKFNGIPGTPEFGKLPAWAQANGISVDTFLYDWRAHWQMPSNTALYEAQSRFRPDRPEYEQYVANHTAWVLGGKIGDEPEEPPVFMPADIQRALEVNDLMPKFVPMVMGLAYQPITRTDAVRAYELGVFDDSQLYHAMRDNRYDDKTARTLVDFYTQQRARRLNNASGVWTIRKILKAYKGGSLNRSESFDLLAPLMRNPQQRQAALDGADTEVKAETKEAWIKVYRRAFFTGESNLVQTEKDLDSIGVDAQRISDLTNKWTSEKMGRYREATVRQLMDWAVNNLITADNLKARLTTLGYSDIDSNRIIYTAAYRQDKLVKAEIEKVVKDLEKRFKDQSQAKKATQDELIKRKKELDKEAERIQKELDVRKTPNP